VMIKSVNESGTSAGRESVQITFEHYQQLFVSVDIG